MSWCNCVLFRLLVIFLWYWVMNGMVEFLLRSCMVVVIWCGWMDSLVVMCCMILSVMVFVMLWMVCLFVEIVVWVGRFGVVGCLVGLMG